jgi:hypothetical protein
MMIGVGAVPSGGSEDYASIRPFPPQSLYERLQVWTHNHPTTAKVILVAEIVLGMAMIASIPAFPIVGIGAVIGLSIAGAVLATSAAITMVALDILAPPHHDMAHHSFKPGQCEGGRLYYEGDIPILSLTSDDPRTVGTAHGYLCGEAISCLVRKFDFVLHTIVGKPRAKDLLQTLAALRRLIPADYLLEMEGLVDGYHRWCNEQHWWTFPKKFTLDEALLMHLLPDSGHLNPQSHEMNVAQPSVATAAVACSAIIDQNEDGTMVFARNMDWPSLGVTGTFSMVINRKHSDGRPNTVEVGIPGFIGTLTGMNSHGLSLAMNVCAGWTPSLTEMPSIFYNRCCLEQCHTVEEVHDFITRHDPVGPYHLTVADATHGTSFHMMQGSSIARVMDKDPLAKKHCIRQWEKAHPLITLNCRYDPEPSHHMHYSKERQAVLDHFFGHRNGRPLSDVLALPFVNNLITTHRVVMEPAKKRMLVAFDNALAGQAPLHTVPTQQLLV